MNRILCVTGVLCLTGVLTVACGSDDDQSVFGGSDAGIGGGGSGGTAGSSSAGTGGTGATGGTGGTGATGGTGGTGATGGTGTAGTAGADAGNVPEAGPNPEGGSTAPEGGTTTGEPFSMCASDGDCSDGLVCLRSGASQPSAQLPGYCTAPGCQGPDAAACPQPTTGNVESTCSQIADVCTLDCTTNTECPNGMECQTVPGMLERCVYPEQTIPPPALYEECTVAAGCGTDAACNPFLLHCAETCTDPTDCTAPMTGSAVLGCSQTTSLCILDCADGKECPTGMTCETQQSSGLELCTF